MNCLTYGNLEWVATGGTAWNLLVQHDARSSNATVLHATTILRSTNNIYTVSSRKSRSVEAIRIVSLSNEGPSHSVINLWTKRVVAALGRDYLSDWIVLLVCAW